ncbi:hypothetical protein D9M68_915530 [compost metagenome]
MARSESIGWSIRQPTRFVVSGVLQKNGEQSIIKPVHAIEIAESEDMAVRKFADSLAREFKGYTLISTLATRIPAVGVCETNI